MSTTIQQALNFYTKKLKKLNLATASLDAEVLLSFVLKKSKEFLYTYPEKKLIPRQTKKFKELIRRRSKFEPVAYLTGHKEFYGLDFYVDKRVLIPRPVTELLVDEVINLARNKKMVIADIGTGSGCIAVILAKKLPEAKIYTVDICRKALTVAKKNAKNNKVKITFLAGNLLEPIRGKKIDVVIANLPYMDNEKQNFHHSLNIAGLNYEPQKALQGGKYGLEIYEKFFQQLSQGLIKPKIIICEIGHAYSKKTKKLAKKYLPNSQVKIKKDLAGFDQFLIIKLKKRSPQSNSTAGSTTT